MGSFWKATCAGCSKEFTYVYKGGRPRKFCTECKPKGPRHSYSAYARARPFPWGHLPSNWFISRAGNACRTIGRHCISVYPRGRCFWMSFPTMRHEQPRISEIQALPENVFSALRWAERAAENVLRSFATH